MRKKGEAFFGVGVKSLVVEKSVLTSSAPIDTQVGGHSTSTHFCQIHIKIYFKAVTLPIHLAA